MAIDSEDSVSLPVPPPPRPVARRGAIDAALRKFDGIDEPAVRERPRRIAWASLNRRPAGALVAAALIVAVSIPVIRIALRDLPPETASESAPPGIVAENQPAAETTPANEPPSAQANVAVAAEAESLPTKPVALEERANVAAAGRDQKAMLAPPSPAMAAPVALPMAAAPPPPPPPPPAAEPQAEAADVGNIVVTGTRIPENKSEGFAQRAEAPLTASEIAAPYGEFLNRLQEALSGNDRRAVLRLVSLPLRVNFASGARTYRTRQDVERDYDRIFTPAVREAALNMGSYDIASRDGGRLRGSGRIWFGCGNRICSSEEVIKVREINP